MYLFTHLSVDLRLKTAKLKATSKGRGVIPAVLKNISKRNSREELDNEWEAELQEIVVIRSIALWLACFWCA